MFSKRKSKGFIIGIAVAVLLPLSFFLYYDDSVSNALNIPRNYRPIGVDSHIVKGKTTYDTIYHKVSDLKLVNQLGKEVSINNDLRGKILVVNFFFTQCGTVCPQLTSNIAHIVKSFQKKNTDIVQFLSISVDPNDSVAALRAYADKYTTQHDRWWFLTGNKDSIYNYAKNELGLVLDAEKSEDFLHSQQVVLIDTFRNIRGYYDGLDGPNSLSKTGDDVILLKLEKQKPKKFKNAN